MTKAAINPRNIPMDLHRGSSREVTSDVGQHASVEDGSVSQQAVEVESVSQQASATAGAGAQHVDSGSSINLISLVMIFPSIIFDL
jgi:hypothetical protein